MSFWNKLGEKLLRSFNFITLKVFQQNKLESTKEDEDLSEDETPFSMGRVNTDPNLEAENSSTGNLSNESVQDGVTETSLYTYEDDYSFYENSSDELEIPSFEKDPENEISHSLVHIIQYSDKEKDTGLIYSAKQDIIENLPSLLHKKSEIPFTMETMMSWTGEVFPEESDDTTTTVLAVPSLIKIRIPWTDTALGTTLSLKSVLTFLVFPMGDANEFFQPSHRTLWVTYSPGMTLHFPEWDDETTAVFYNWSGRLYTVPTLFWLMEPGVFLFLEQQDHQWCCKQAVVMYPEPTRLIDVHWDARLFSPLHFSNTSVGDFILSNQTCINLYAPSAKVNIDETHWMDHMTLFRKTDEFEKWIDHPWILYAFTFAKTEKRMFQGYSFVWVSHLIAIRLKEYDTLLLNQLPLPHSQRIGKLLSYKVVQDPQRFTDPIETWPKSILYLSQWLFPCWLPTTQRKQRIDTDQEWTLSTENSILTCTVLKGRVYPPLDNTRWNTPLLQTPLLRVLKAIRENTLDTLNSPQLLDEAKDEAYARFTSESQAAGWDSQFPFRWSYMFNLVLDTLTKETKRVGK
jgi:hypothetical protein